MSKDYIIEEDEETKKIWNAIPKIEKEDTFYDAFKRSVDNYPNSVIYFERFFDKEKNAFTEKLISHTAKEVWDEGELIGSGMASLGLKQGDFVYEAYNPVKQMFSIMHGTLRQGAIKSSYSYFTDSKLFFEIFNPRIAFCYFDTAHQLVDDAISCKSSIKAEYKEDLHLKGIILLPFTADKYLDDGENEETIQKKAEELEKKLKDNGLGSIKVISYKKLLELGKKNPVPPCEQKPDAIGACLATSRTTSSNHIKIVKITNNNIAFYALQYRIVFPKDVTVNIMKSNHNGSISDIYKYSCAIINSNCSVNFCYNTNNYENYRIFSPTYLSENSSFFKTLYDIFQVKIKENNDKIDKEIKEKFNKLSDEEKKSIKKQKENQFIEKIKKEYLGSNIKYFNYYGAKMSKEMILFFFETLKLSLIICYGATEMSLCMLTELKNANFPPNYIGKPFPNYKYVIRPLKVKKEEKDVDGLTGELLVASPILSKGYLRNDELTKKAIDENGYFHSGDIVKYDINKNIFVIIDRLNNLINLRNSFQIPATQVESLLTNSNLIKQAVVYGDDTFENVVYVIVPNYDNIKNYVKESNKGNSLSDDTVRAVLQKELETIYKKPGFLLHYRCKDFVISKEEWTCKNDLFTESGKIKRDAVVKKYMKEIKDINEK